MSMGISLNVNEQLQLVGLTLSRFLVTLDNNNNKHKQVYIFYINNLSVNGQ